MSPRRHITAPPQSVPNHTTPLQKRNTRNSNNRPAPTQTTIWQFIRPIIAIQTPNLDPSLHHNLDNPPELSGDARRDSNCAPTSLTPTTQSSDDSATTLRSHSNATILTPPNQLPNQDPVLQEYTSPMQQRPLHIDKTNEGWGDLHHYAIPCNHFRVISKNVSTLNPYSMDVTAITTEFHTMQASLFCAQETNTAWKLTTLQAFKNQCRAIYPYHKLAVSSSQETTEGWFQPGGTATIALDVWASQVIGWGSEQNLG